eukprot:TRINITY_DN12689_c0_g2_i1.p1 TRINITY_DN12689_c0_g2~~TRINITY_DN12689_c0_g2_i1.p1  ORF type:complete len:283 (-),score=51.18 TRINITY_DN12689_c0_g2_i1:77-925(-)
MSLFGIFESGLNSVGIYPQRFAFKQGVTPLSTNWEVALTAIVYLVVIFGGRAIMTKFQPFKLTWLVLLHNAFLSFISFVLLVLLLEQLIPIWATKGFYASVCHLDTWSQKLEFLYYINYLIKYYELLDTVLLVLKKRPLEFLHYFHHSMTMILCYSQLVGQTAVSWVPITLNLCVHVVMYYYYFKTAQGVRVWWKEYLTSMQITQFVIDLAVIYFVVYNRYTHIHFPHLPHVGRCDGGDGAALFGASLLTSYLFLFINFYIQTYKTQTRTRGPVPQQVKKQN